MRKNLLLIFGLITAFPEVSGCSDATIPSNTSGNQIIETEKTKRYEFDLTLDNYWRYFDETGTMSGGYRSYTTLSYSISGILSYAYYENVTMKFSVKLDDTVNHSFDKTIELKANGNGSITYTYETKVTDDQDFYWYSRELIIDNISGKVIFSI